MTISRNFSVMAQGASTAGVLSPPYGGALQWQAVQTTSFAAVAGRAYLVNTTSGAVTVTLSASPTIGQMVQITDYAGTFATNSCTINPNGNKINSNSLNVILSTNRQSVAIVYTDSTQGWVAYSAFNTTTLPQTNIASYLIVAGGGGAQQGGGGAGGFLTGSVTLTSGSVYTITVGGGGASGANGGNSSITGLTTAIGGGAGGLGANGVSGGSGGGGGENTSTTTGGSGTFGQGNAGGGNGGFIASPYPGGGGGGAGAAGGSGTSNTVAGNGGAGLSSSITGSSVFYAGGGGGGLYAAGGTAGVGGTGGGGNGSSNAANGAAGTTNTGGGGGGSGQNFSGGAGGSGVVILSVLTAFYTGNTTGSPTVTTSGSNTILKFTTSGSYTA